MQISKEKLNNQFLLSYNVERMTWAYVCDGITHAHHPNDFKLHQ